MIITQSTAFSTTQIISLREAFDVYIKTVIDVNKKICSAGMNMHYEGEKLLLEMGSKQSDIWGGGIDLETKTIDFNSFINIRPLANNTSNEIQDAETRKKFEELIKYFFATFMNDQAVRIAAMAMDLKRVVLAIQRGSPKVAEKFAEEVKNKINLVNKAKEKPYIVKMLELLPLKLGDLTNQQTSEDLLMYSTLFQNRATSKI